MKTINKSVKTVLFYFVLAITLTSCSSAKKDIISAKNNQEKLNLKSLKVMSFNIRYNNPADNQNSWENRRKACVAMINDVQPDIFGVQEALPDQMNYFDSSLINYSWVGVGRDSLITNNEYSAVFFRKDKFELLSSNTFWLSETPDIQSKGWDAKYKRIATWALLKNKQTAEKILMMNTHFDHKGQIARKESAKLLIEKIKQLSDDKTMVILTGDFNATPKEELFEPISEYMNSSHLKAEITDSLGTTNGFGTEPPGKIIDYIFYRNVIPLKYQTLIKNYGIPYISDHYPIIATFKY